MRLLRTVLIIGMTLGCTTTAIAAEWDHVHLSSDDPPKAADWYTEQFGGERTESGPYPAVLFDGMLVKFKPGKEGYGKSEGSAVDHIGFSVQDVAAKLKALEAQGATITQEARNIKVAGFTYGFFEDPWGTKVELIDDKDTTGFHHVHVAASDVPKALQWYKAAFGGKIEPFKGFAPVRGIRYGDMWLMVMGAKETPAPIAGRAIEHLGWRVPDMEEFQKTLTDIGGKFTMGPQKNGEGHLFGFMENTAGVKIEIIEHKPAK